MNPISALGDKIAEILGWLIAKIWEWTVSPFAELKSLRNWVFGGDADEKWIYGTFTEKEFSEIFYPGYTTMMFVAGSLFIMAIIIHGMRIQTAAVNPSARNALIEFLKDLAIVAICLFNIDLLFSIIFNINSGFIDLFSQSYEMDEMESVLDPSDDGIIGRLFINLVLLGLSVWANFYYMMRKFTLIVLMILSPLFAVMYLFPQTKGITLAGFKEFTGTVFVNSIHAFVYWVLSLFATSSATGIETVILYIIFIPIGESLRAIFGLGGDMTKRLNQAGAMMGLSALSGMAGAVKGAMGDQSVMGALQGMYKGVKDGKKNQGGQGELEEGKSTITGNTGTDTGSTSVAEKMLKPGDITSKGGKAVLGIAGSLVGSPLGPVGAIAGAQAGSILGGVAGGLVGRGGAAGIHALSSTVGSRLKKGFEAGRNELNRQSMDAEESILNQIADDETISWGPSYEDFKKEMREKFPDADEKGLSRMWNDRVADHKKGALASVTSAWGNLVPKAEAKDLISKSANDMTDQWAKDNKEAFMKEFAEQNPPAKPLSEMSPSEQTAYQNKQISAWNNKLNDKKEQFSNMANSASQSLIGKSNGPIDRKEFANAFANSIQEANKAEFVSKNPQLPSDQIEVEFEKAHGNQQKVTAQVANSSAESAKSYLMPNGKPNNEAIAHFMASRKTGQEGSRYINELKSQGMSESEARTQWEAKESSAFKSNYQTSLAQLPKMVPTSNETIGALKVSSAFLGGATGLSAASKFAQNVATGSFKEFKNATATLPQATTLTGKAERLATSVGYAVLGGAGEVKSSIASNFQGETAVLNQSKYSNALGYAGGVVGGKAGYTNGSKLGAKYNPFNQGVNQFINEPNEVMHLAHTVSDENGNPSIAKGAVRMVTTADQSYIQVRTRTGDTRVVSRMGRGDSSLRKGEVVYQDLNVENGAFVVKPLPGTKTSAYKLDSGGGKIPSNRTVNVNPNKLLSNRAPKGVQMPVEKTAFNQNVDAGQFYSDDIRDQQFEKVQLVVEKGRSYLQGRKGGKDYRISPYKQGDARIPVGQSVSQPVTFRNRTMVVQNEVVQYEVNGREEIYSSSLDPNDYAVPKPNKRYITRSNIEQSRYKGVSF